MKSYKISVIKKGEKYPIYEKSVLALNKCDAYALVKKDVKALLEKNRAEIKIEEGN